MDNDIGQRQLAAIVFTDVAGFSSKIGADEEKTLRRVREDLELLMALSGEHGGRIIKTMGDGLLVSFGTAIDAVSFAIAGQRKIAARNKTLPPGNRLKHRMGIHLGDIYLSDTDAMGDGVNIAARLQSEAEPGGICVSQTVYDVVKNKLSINAVSLGPRELKNIREAIYAYRIVVDAESSLARKAAPGETSRKGKRRGRGLVYAVIAIGVVLALLIVVRLVARFRLARVLRERASQEETAEAAPALPGQIRPEALARVGSRLARHGRENPLIVRVPRRRTSGSGSAGTVEIAVWMQGDEVLLGIEGQVRRRHLARLDPQFFAAIAAELNREARRGGGAPSD